MIRYKWNLDKLVESRVITHCKTCNDRNDCHESVNCWAYYRGKILEEMLEDVLAQMNKHEEEMNYDNNS